MHNEFAKFIKTNEIRFKYAKGMRDIIGNEIHPYHEIFFYMGGDARFISEEGAERLLPFTTVYIPKETFHSFDVLGKDCDYIRCVFKFDSVSELDEIISEKMKKIFILRDETITNLFLQIKDITDTSMPEKEKNIVMKSVFAQILVYTMESEQYLFESTIHPLTEKVLDYIENNINKSLNIKDIANELYMSESHLAHIFKRDLHIPVHKYILEKRLVLSNKKIKSGVNPTHAALDCGFQDYSGFFRQYKKMFGVSPAKDKK